jgi:hypothetical protein
LLIFQKDFNTLFEYRDKIPRKRNPKMRTLIKYAALIAVVFLLCILVIVTIHRKIDVKFKNGGSVKMRAAAILGSRSGSTCRVEIDSKSGKHAGLDLFQDWANMPLMVIPTTNEDVFLCIYDYDVDFQLLRLDLSKKYQPLKASVFIRANVSRSDCEVTRVLKTDADDWSNAVDTIQQMSAHQYRRGANGLELGIFSLHTTQKTLLNSLRNFGNQDQYPAALDEPPVTQSLNTNQGIPPTPER